MFKKRTVFVVGAGAGKAYGFPTGDELKRDASGLGSHGLQARTQNHISYDQAKALVKQLEDPVLHGSIDAAIEHRTGLHIPGKCVIAALILGYEWRYRKKRSTSTFSKKAAAIPYVDPKKEGDWLGWIFQKMWADEGSQSLEAFCSNPVWFVTFNYDRLIENRIITTLKRSFEGLSSTECWAEFQRRGIVHLHGSVGPLFVDVATAPADIIKFGVESAPGNDAFARAMIASNTNIKIVHEPLKDSDPYKRGRELLRKAEQVIFLGFGFAPENVERLDLKNLPMGIHILSSATGWTDKEIGRHILDLFPGRGASGPDCYKGTILDMFRARGDIAD